VRKAATGATSAGSKPDGKLVHRQTDGANIGKMLVKVSEPTVVSTAT
jgi:hypothetical protein